jgi:hypothetical protein
VPLPPRALFVLVDGLGLGSRDPRENPIHRGACPRLERILENHARPIDACLGVPGLPQSATGQTALLTGVNAAARLGRHVEGFPGPELRAIVREHNLLGALRTLGWSVAFANAYFVSDVADVRQRRIQSVTTVAALAALGTVRDTAAMLRGEAVYHDLTRETLLGRGYDGPVIAPREAGRHLRAIARGHDFTLFEYFLTDRAGHRGAAGEVLRVLGHLDALLESLLPSASAGRNLLILTSDHGNIEDCGSGQHTANPVPFVALGRGARFLQRRIRTIADVSPAIEFLYRNPRAATDDTR